MKDEEPVIQKTTDYKMFNRLVGNRTKHEILIQQLMESFSEKPQLRVARPVLLNEKYEMIDGQHRLEASTRLKIPVYYMVVPGLTVDDARLLNALQRTWNIMDYAKSFAETGHPEYRYFMNLIKEYELTPGIMLKYTTLIGTRDYNQTHKFKIGQYEPRDKLKTKVWLESLKEFTPYTADWKSQAFSLAILRLLKDKHYDHERMMNKIEDTGRLDNHGAAADYLRDLENIYNKGTAIGSRIRFL